MHPVDYTETNAKEEVLSSMWGAYRQRKIRQVFANADVTTAEIIDEAVVGDVQGNGERPASTRR
jgi:hypothetical protein